MRRIHRYNAAGFAARRPDEVHSLVVQKPPNSVAFLTIVKPVILDLNKVRSENFVSPCHIDPALCQDFATLLGIKLDQLESFQTSKQATCKRDISALSVVGERY
jgi:hypothetical protein